MSQFLKSTLYQLECEMYRALICNKRPFCEMRWKYNEKLDLVGRKTAKRDSMPRVSFVYVKRPRKKD